MNAYNKRRVREIKEANIIKWTLKYRELSKEQIAIKIKELEASNPKIPGISHPINQPEIFFLKSLLK